MVRSLHYSTSKLLTWSNDRDCRLQDVHRTELEPIRATELPVQLSLPRLEMVSQPVRADALSTLGCYN